MLSVCCPCRAFFVRLRMLGYTQPVILEDDCYVSFLIYIIMAIINSLAIGKSVKSAGNLTYKTVRGRTIASQRITQNKSNTPFQQNQRQRFAKVSESMKLIQQYIDACYEKSKYGSSRNAFFSTNKRFTLGNFVGEITEGIEPLSRGMLSALTETPSKQLSLLSFGSLAGFLSIKYKDVANYKYGENTFGSLRVIADLSTGDYNEASYTFTFAKPVKYSDLKLYAFGFADSGLLADVGVIEESGVPNFSFDNSPFTTAASLSRVYYSETGSDYITSVDVHFDFTSVQNCPCVIIVPSVGGKVPTIAGVFAKTSAV